MSQILVDSDEGEVECNELQFRGLKTIHEPKKTSGTAGKIHSSAMARPVGIGNDALEEKAASPDELPATQADPYIEAEPPAAAASTYGTDFSQNPGVSWLFGLEEKLKDDKIEIIQEDGKEGSDPGKTSTKQDKEEAAKKNEKRAEPSEEVPANADKGAEGGAQNPDEDDPAAKRQKLLSDPKFKKGTKMKELSPNSQETLKEVRRLRAIENSNAWHNKFVSKGVAREEGADEEAAESEPAAPAEPPAEPAEPAEPESKPRTLKDAHVTRKRLLHC